MTCKYCNGTEKRDGVKTHLQSNKLISVSVPCWCFISKVVSEENKLLAYIGEQYSKNENDGSPRFNPDLVFVYDDLKKSPNLLVQGRGRLADDVFLLNVKSVMMKYRFGQVKPRILFSRAIDIVHDYHVQQDDGTSLHLSSLSVFDLVILKFGTQENNKALAPCLTQLIQNRLEEKKPTWIYYPDVFTVKKEITPELEQMLERYKKVDLAAGESVRENREVNDSLAKGIYT